MKDVCDDCDEQKTSLAFGKKADGRYVCDDCVLNYFPKSLK